MCQSSSSICDELAEQFKFLGREVNGSSLCGNSAFLKIDSKIGRNERRQTLRSGSAKSRAYACRKLFGPERLHDVVVGSRVQCMYLVTFAVANGQHNHRHAAGAADLRAGFESGD